MRARPRYKMNSLPRVLQFLLLQRIYYNAFLSDLCTHIFCSPLTLPSAPPLAHSCPPSPLNSHCHLLFSQLRSSSYEISRILAMCALPSIVCMNHIHVKRVCVCAFENMCTFAFFHLTTRVKVCLHFIRHRFLFTFSRIIVIYDLFFVCVHKNAFFTLLPIYRTFCLRLHFYRVPFLD